MHPGGTALKPHHPLILTPPSEDLIPTPTFAYIVLAHVAVWAQGPLWLHAMLVGITSYGGQELKSTCCKTRGRSVSWFGVLQCATTLNVGTAPAQAHFISWHPPRLAATYMRNALQHTKLEFSLGCVQYLCMYAVCFD